jgi:hypothetical protein
LNASSGVTGRPRVQVAAAAAGGRSRCADPDLPPGLSRALVEEAV